MDTPRIEIASVKVMRSYDYCHFEISLSTSLDGVAMRDDAISIVDDLRKDAARLADKAVEQYKISKAVAFRALHETNESHIRIKALAEIALQTPEHERTIEENAIIKAAADNAYAARRYDYQDDWDLDDQDR